ncbi:GNAT family N-acetyltransferase [Actinoallomurus sp. CA-142502]|uniref:GNAT family N-acetyltransferase n=1 Tax=Actinoallomurus sp. CA-142502 TaxID=3239885 RepID=UPI003D915C5D
MSPAAGEAGGPVTIREFRAGDADAAAALLRPLLPVDELVTPARLLHRHEVLGGDCRWLVAVEGERVVGWAQAERALVAGAGDSYRVWASGGGPAGRNDLAGELLDAAEEWAVSRGARVLRTWSLGDLPAGHGYTLARTDRTSVLDLPCTLGDEDDGPDGYRLVPLAALPDGGRELYRLYTLVDSDAPTEMEAAGLPPDIWERYVRQDPLLAPEGGFVALAGDRPVALTLLDVDRERRVAATHLTGTLREHRGRGLAKRLKRASLRWAAGQGIRTVGASNDATNAAMLAINEGLGYRPAADRLVWVKTLG